MVLIFNELIELPGWLKCGHAWMFQPILLIFWHFLSADRSSHLNVKTTKIPGGIEQTSENLENVKFE